MAPMKKRRLGDLYQVGRQIEIDDDSDDPVAVWVQKLNPLETEKAARRASANKARILLARNDRESEEWMTTYSEVSEMPRSSLVELCIGEEVAKAYESADAEIAAEDQWAKDGYLQGLQDAWNDGLIKVHDAADEADPDFAEAERVFSELTRFDGIVGKRVQGERDRLLRDYEEVPKHELWEKVVGKLFDIRGDNAWIREFRRSQLWLAVREPEDHKKLYFAKREEIDALPTPVLTTLMETMESLLVDPTEGKDLPPTQDSSPPSEQRDEGETADSSGLKVVAQ